MTPCCKKLAGTEINLKIQNEKVAIFCGLAQSYLIYIAYINLL